MSLLLYTLFIPILLFSSPSSSDDLDLYLSDNETAAAATASTLSYRIDCGGEGNSTALPAAAPWLADAFYSGGGAAAVSDPSRFSLPQQRTLRYFPPVASGKKNCYLVPAPAGRYYLRTFTAYGNYDGKLRPPSFDVAVEGTVVFGWRSPWPEAVRFSGAYSDLFVFVGDGEADVCFYSIATDAPVIGTLEIVEIDSSAYNLSGDGIAGGGGEDDENENVLLVNYGRLNCGVDERGLGIDESIDDRFGRAWQSDLAFRVDNSFLSSQLVRNLETRTGVSRANQPPNYFPMKLYQTAVVMPGGIRALEYKIPVDSRLDYMVWLHFAEIDAGVTAAGRRVFDVHINQKNVSRIDIFERVGGFAAFDWQYRVRNLSSTYLSVRLVPVIGDPLLCGLENYALVPKDLQTAQEQVIAMRALKESLRVPERMGWNGDPCAPSSWDAWEGVTCRIDKNRSALVVSQMDLSDNQFSGYIPDSLEASSLQIVLLNDNQLEGQVSEKLYSVGIHGGLIDLTGNKGLCGVPTLPQCSLFWDRGALSTGSKLAIGLSFLVLLTVALLTIFVYHVRKRRNDYNFDIPHNLISTAIAAKRNRYQRQKSALVFEMETQNVSRFPTTLNPL
ncbi:hypothetical protein Syun_022874 [Stephania yunnanensis]|uniref:Malectin-like domain-containing protein n=1 Tax=Stephania yunnanensis TaxID=152371 RepID=A0AAP0FEL6_9MAGN